MRQTKINPENIETAIRHMQYCEVGYTVPWAMYVDAKLNCWLNPNYSVQPMAFGTACMEVQKNELGEYLVSIPKAQRYTPSASPGYVGYNGVGIPVAEVTYY